MRTTGRTPSSCGRTSKGGRTVPRRILALETSCDETAAAVVEDGERVLANVVASQIDRHRAFGGVVPEIAARMHVEAVIAVVDEALRRAGVPLSAIDAVAVTHGPGLVGSLLVGVQVAKGLAFARDVPLIAVHHLAGHIYANRFVRPLRFPLVALVVSGGHTEIVYMPEDGAFVPLGGTLDDAVGEAYDKIGRLLGLPYPAGPHLDRLAQEGTPRFLLPSPRPREGGRYALSFSGLKTHLRRLLEEAEARGETLPAADVAASFQQAVVAALREVAAEALRETGARQLVLAGGVAANRDLRAALRALAEEADVEFVVPPPELCTDNAAMIGAYADVLYVHGVFADWSLGAAADLPLAAASLPGRPTIREAPPGPTRKAAAVIPRFSTEPVDVGDNPGITRG
ncbi:MAG: tRNA (adenosine(37)-N6)-threonylcarbamoyltransferase complex transferase subunit TsaD [Hydrogenibacillus schlegelii]|nr:tRNA (adenosine(37)-N6)-threonylcarbamoyltransferase complex transferase subunit TsaD [Hydrogenibacillus schlegelii]